MTRKTKLSGWGIGGLAALLALIVTIGVIAIGGGDASATNRGGMGKKANERANGQIEDITRCFAFSIDKVGRGSLDDGIAGFDKCLADDYVFEFQAFPGGPTTVCPGDGCPVQEFSSLAEMRALFAYNFFVDAGYQATQHQVFNIDIERQGRHAEVFAYIQANHFLPDNTVDIAWNDYVYSAERRNGRWVMTKETIIGTAFLNFEGDIVGGGDDAGSSDGGDEEEQDCRPLTPAADITLRNTLQDPGEAEATYASLFGQADDAFDEFSSVSKTHVEFPAALAQQGTPAGDINGLYEIDFTESSIDFAVVAEAEDPFWSGVFGLFPEGKVDRYYFTFGVPHNVKSFSSDNPNLNVRIDSSTQLVVELTGGYDLQPGVAFTVELNP